MKESQYWGLVTFIGLVLIMLGYIANQLSAIEGILKGTL